MRSWIPESSSPSYFLYLTIDLSRIDVNVHPQKTEVKFADEEAVWQIVNAAVRETLAKTGAVPLMDFDREGIVEIPVLTKGAVSESRGPCPTANTILFREEYIDPSAPDPERRFRRIRRAVQRQRPNSLRQCRRGASLCVVEDAVQVSLCRAACAAPEVGDFLRPGSGADEFFRFPLRRTTPSEDFVSGGGFEVTSESGFDASELEFIPSEATVEQQRLDVDGRPEFTDPLPLGGGYVAALLGGRFVVVDVRRARERVLYEDYLKMLGSGSSVSQQLLFPERLVLSDSEYALLEENAVEFASLGFDLDFQGDCAVEVKGTPADMPADSVDQLLLRTAAGLLDARVAGRDVRREKIAAVMARGAAKQTVRLMSRDEAAALLARLAASGNFSFFAIGQSHNRRDNRRRYPGQVGIIRRKNVHLHKFSAP